jgi:formylglycine-generating enzyme required for sulfatase activity
VIEMSDCEVTVEQYRAIFPGVLHETRLSPGPDCPINNVSGFEAAGLCNRLSGDCRIPGSDWAYEGPGDPAMSGRSGPDLLPDGLDRPGFRLPTAGEFEHAARGGAGARSLFFGDASELLSAYAWYLENIEVKRAQPVAGRKPTAAGFFDLLGNLREWAEDELAPAVPGRRVLLGHGCASPGEQVVSGGLDVLRCDGGNRAALWTFRVARTLRR